MKEKRYLIFFMGGFCLLFSFVILEVKDLRYSLEWPMDEG